MTLLRSTSPARSTAAGCYKSSERVFRKIKRSEKKKKEKNSHLGCMLLIWMVFFPASSDPSPAFPSHLSHPHTHTHIHTHTHAATLPEGREGGREGGGEKTRGGRGKKKTPKPSHPGSSHFKLARRGGASSARTKPPPLAPGQRANITPRHRCPGGTRVRAPGRTIAGAGAEPATGLGRATRSLPLLLFTECY